jgi:adenosylcobinamide-GDP ribazoletransferase
VNDLAGIRFAFGTLTVLPVTLTRWDRGAARAGMLCAPLPGLVLGLAASAAGGLLLLTGADPLLAAVASVAVPAVLTRGLHLDGLGSGRPAEEALAVMKRSDIGPFGVITLLLVLLAQTAVLAGLYVEGWPQGAAAVVVSAVTARLALTLAARPGIPAARQDGLGAAVAEVVPDRLALGVAALVTVCAAGAGALAGADGEGGVLYGAAHHALAVLCGLAGARLLLRHCVRRFGGVTGDVFGGLAETAATTSLVVLALGL